MDQNHVLHKSSLMLKKRKFLIQNTPTGTKRINTSLASSQHLSQKKVLATVYGLNTSHQAWIALATTFASKSKSRISHLKKQLQNLSQGTKPYSDCVQSAKTLANQLGAAGNPILDEEIISLILHGLNSSFTHFITTYSFHTRANGISLDDF